MLFFLSANAIPDEFPRPQERNLSVWQFTGIITVLMLVSTMLCSVFDPHRLGFLMLVLLFLVLLTAKVRGMALALFALAIASIVISYVLPPSNTIWISTSRDRMFLAAFVFFGIAGSRLVGRRQEIY